MSPFLCWRKQLINVEAVVGPVGELPQNFVVLSLTDDADSVMDIAISTDDARQMVDGILEALAEHGDELADEIRERYFSD